MGTVAKLLRLGGSLVLVVAASGGEGHENLSDLMVLSPVFIICRSVVLVEG